jgi:hypothetical protein
MNVTTKAKKKMFFHNFVTMWFFMKCYNDVTIYHHQPNNVLTAGAQAFLVDWITHKENGPHAGPVQIAGC